MTLQERMHKATDDMIEHCEGVIILASVAEESRDAILYSYRGSYHTAIGLMEDFKLKKSLEHLAPPNEDEETECAE
jgi:hypothetical protein